MNNDNIMNKNLGKVSPLVILAILLLPISILFIVVKLAKKYS